jgi:hypothetical protein
MRDEKMMEASALGLGWRQKDSTYWLETNDFFIIFILYLCLQGHAGVTTFLGSIVPKKKVGKSRH